MPRGAQGAEIGNRHQGPKSISLPEGNETQDISGEAVNKNQTHYLKPGECIFQIRTGAKKAQFTSLVSNDMCFSFPKIKGRIKNICATNNQTISWLKDQKGSLKDPTVRPLRISKSQAGAISKLAHRKG